MMVQVGVAALAAGVSERTMRYRAARGQVRAVKHGKTWWVDLDSVLGFDRDPSLPIVSVLSQEVAE